MNRILFIFFIILLFNIFLIPFTLIQNSVADNFEKKNEKNIEEDKKRKKFILEMEKLIDAATKSGFSEKEVREINVVRNGKVLYVWDFLEQEKLRIKKEEIIKKKFRTRDRYLTVIDISDELESFETKNLDNLKDKSIFVGAEER